MHEPGGRAHGIGFVDLDGDTAGIIRPSSAQMGKPASSALRRAVRQLEEALAKRQRRTSDALQVHAIVRAHALDTNVAA
jgi:hypothetical protein